MLESLDEEALAEQLAEELLQKYISEAKAELHLTEVVAEAVKPKLQVEQKPEEKEEEVVRVVDTKDEAYYQLNELKVAKEIREVEAFVDFMKNLVRISDVVEALQRPNHRDPMKVLAQLRASEGEESFLDESSSHLGHLIIPIEDYIEMEQLWQVQRRGEQQTVDHRPMFDAFNEALDNERPYKSKGMPMPWSKQKRVTASRVTEQQA